MIWLVIIGVILIIVGIWMFILNLRGTHFIYEVFGIIPIPFSFWGPILMIIVGLFMGNAGLFAIGTGSASWFAI